jgi:hypothetical protein
VVDLEIIRNVALGELDGLEHRAQVPRLLLDLDHVAGPQPIAWNGDPLAVHPHMAVIDELARRKRRRDELGPVDHRVEPTLEQADQVFRRIALEPGGLVINRAELLFRDVGVIALELLLRLELGAEIRQLSLAPLAMLPGAVFALVDRAFRAAPDVLAHAPVDLVFRGCALRHFTASPNSGK